MAINEKFLGYSLIVFSIVLFAILIYIKVQVDKESSYLCEKFHENQLNMATCPVHQTNSFWEKISWLLTLAFGVDFIIFGFGIYIAFFYKYLSKEPKKDFKQIDISRLTEDERKIYDTVKNNNGSSYQTDLIKETGFSKVKVTRILDKMESMDILERKRRGMTNIIVLK